MISVRAEKDRDTIKRFGPHERKLRADWAKFKAEKYKASIAPLDLATLQNMLAGMFIAKKEVKA